MEVGFVLQVEPQLGAGAQHSGDARGQSGLDARLAVDDLAHVLARAAHGLGKGRDADAPLVQVQFLQNRSGGDGSAFGFGHAFSLLSGSPQN